MTDFRFDDLDLREEAAQPTREQGQIYSGALPLHAAPGVTTTVQTHVCCV